MVNGLVKDGRTRVDAAQRDRSGLVGRYKKPRRSILLALVRRIDRRVFRRSHNELSNHVFKISLGYLPDLLTLRL